MLFGKKEKIVELSSDSVDLVIKSICCNCEKNEYCNSAKKNDLCMRLDIISNLLHDKVKLNNLVIINEKSG